MIDLNTETIISLTEVARRLPTGRRGRPVHLSCVLRWILDGAPASDGTRVRLEGLRVGGRWITSDQAVQRFAERLTPRLDSAPPPRTPAKRSKAADRAARELTAMGI